MDNVLKEIAYENVGPSACSNLCRAIAKNFPGKLKIIEIGTAYGESLPAITKFANSVICIDPMYDWVPDVHESEVFDKNRTDAKKLTAWNKSAQSCKDAGNAYPELVIGSSYHVHADVSLQEKFAETDVLIVDGCHHPPVEVAKDYTNFFKFMKSPHYVIFDDFTTCTDVKNGVEIVREFLKKQGLSAEERIFNQSFGAIVFYVSA